MRVWIKNSDGRPDAVLTFATGAVAVVLFKLLLAGLTLKFGTWFTYTIGALDAASIAAVFTPTLGAYVTNRYVNLTQHPDYVKMKKDIDGDGKDDEIFVPKKE